VPRSSFTIIPRVPKTDPKALSRFAPAPFPSVHFRLPNGLSSVVLDTFTLYQRSNITASDLKGLCGFYLNWMRTVTGSHLRPKDADVILDHLQGAESTLTDITFHNLPHHEINNLKTYIYILFHLCWELLTPKKRYGALVAGWMACSDLTMLYLRLLRAMSKSAILVTGACIGAPGSLISATSCYTQLISNGLSVILAAAASRDDDRVKYTSAATQNKPLDSSRGVEHHR
jgi:hypothetical protein